MCVNLVLIIDTLSWCKVWQHNGFNLVCAKPKLRRRRKGVRESFSNRQKSRKSFTLTIHWNLANLVKIYHGIIVLLYHIDPRRRDC